MSDTTGTPVRPGEISDEEHAWWYGAADRAFKHAKAVIEEALGGVARELTDAERRFVLGIARNGGTDELTSILRKTRRDVRRENASAPAPDPNGAQLVESLLGGGLDRLNAAVQSLDSDDLIDLREGFDVLMTAIGKERDERDWVRRREG
jgi:hypothetical protein